MRGTAQFLHDDCNPPHTTTLWSWEPITVKSSNFDYKQESYTSRILFIYRTANHDTSYRSTVILYIIRAQLDNNKKSADTVQISWSLHYTVIGNFNLFSSTK